MPTTAIPANVERGAEFLDRQLPGWDDRITLRTLDLGSTCQCVVGQLHREGRSDHGAYLRGLDALGLREGEAAKLGFSTYASQTFTRLTDGWKELIRRRRRARRTTH